MEDGYREFLLEKKDKFESARIREGEHLDNRVFWASTGALSISATLLTSWSSGVALQCIFILFASWVFLLGCLVAHVLAYYFSREFHKKVEDEIIVWLDNPQEQHYPGPSLKALKIQLLADRFTDYSIFLLPAGLFLMTIFTALNVYSVGT